MHQQRNGKLLRGDPTSTETTIAMHGPHTFVRHTGPRMYKLNRHDPSVRCATVGKLRGTPGPAPDPWETICKSGYDTFGHSLFASRSKTDSQEEQLAFQRFMERSESDEGFDVQSINLRYAWSVERPEDVGNH